MTGVQTCALPIWAGGIGQRVGRDDAGEGAALEGGGLEGLLALQATSDAVVIVDVLSFSTAVDIALSKGASVLPYRWKDDSAKRFAAEKGPFSPTDAALAGLEVLYTSRFSVTTCPAAIPPFLRRAS